MLYDPFSPGVAFSLRGLYVSIQPLDDIGYPFAFEQIAVFAQLFGDPGEYRVWVEAYLLDENHDNGERVLKQGPVSVRVRPGRFLEGIDIRLREVAFPRPGLYEFVLRRDGFDEALITERLLLKE